MTDHPVPGNLIVVLEEKDITLRPCPAIVLLNHEGVTWFNWDDWSTKPGDVSGQPGISIAVTQPLGFIPFISEGIGEYHDRRAVLTYAVFPTAIGWLNVSRLEDDQAR